MLVPFVCFPYLFDKPLAESSRDPLSSMDTTIQEDSGLGGVRPLAELCLLQRMIQCLLNDIKQ